MIELVGYNEKDDKYPCYLYWIRTVTMSDMFSEGYIGITSNIHQRLSSHKGRLESRTDDISEKFVDAYHNNDNLIMQILSSGNRAEMEVDEYTLRPKRDIGWNRKFGGGGRAYSETYYPQKVVLTYRRMMKLYSTACDQNFKTDDVLKIFCTLYSDSEVPKHHSIVLKDVSKGLFLDNLTVKKTQKFCELEGFLFYEGSYLTRLEASKMFGVNKKTIDKRMQYGFTPREAVGLDEYVRKNEVRFKLGGKEVFIVDNGSTNMDVEFYKEAYGHYTSGNRTFTKYCRDNGMFGANVTRLFKKFGLKSKTDLRSNKEVLC